MFVLTVHRAATQTPLLGCEERSHSLISQRRCLAALFQKRASLLLADLVQVYGIILNTLSLRQGIYHTYSPPPSADNSPRQLSRILVFVHSLMRLYCLLAARVSEYQQSLLCSLKSAWYFSISYFWINKWEQ